MKEAAMPKAFLDFADALRMLSQCSLDATELVTKWDQITDTTTPAVVTITVNGATHNVDNLAKIRQDLTAGLSIDYPTVRGIEFVDRQSKGSAGPVTSYGLNWKDSGGIPYQDDSGYLGVYHSVCNDFYTACMPSKVDVTARFLELPKVVMLGAARETGVLPPDTLNLTVEAPTASFVQIGALDNQMYYTKVTFVNRNAGRILPDGSAEHAEGLPFTFSIFNVTGAQLYSKVLSSYESVTLLIYTAPGLSTVNIQEVK